MRRTGLASGAALLAVLTTLTTLDVTALVAPVTAASAASTPDHCRRTLPAYPILRPGAHRRAVRTLQCALNDTGYGPVVVDGWYGPQTRRAVRRIERGFEVAIAHPGRVNNGYWTLLYGRQLPARVLRIGDRGHAVRVLQRAMRAAGADIVVDGWFGPQTRRVVRSYQRELQLRPTGRCNSATVFMLGQGGVFGHLS